jgi:DNA polymerase III delta prime subunit
MNKEFLFVESYAPKKIEDCILPENLKSYFRDIRDSGNVPNMILAAGSGCGKTSTIRALAQDLQRDFMIINGSDERSIDVIRNKVKNYASTVSLSQTGKKILLIDEGDNLTHDAQLALRASIEELQGNCSFIFTCNYKNKIIQPLHSRCAVIDFTISSKEKPKIAAEFFKRVCFILDTEKIPYEPKVLVEVISKYFPDFRRTLNEIQRYASSGAIDTGILAQVSDVKISSLVKHMQEKNFKEVRKWVVENLDNDPNIILRKIYDSLYENLVPTSIPEAILIIADYQYKSAFVCDNEINLLACLIELMCKVTFK